MNRNVNAKKPRRTTSIIAVSVAVLLLVAVGAVHSESRTTILAQLPEAGGPNALFVPPEGVTTADDPAGITPEPTAIAPDPTQVPPTATPAPQLANVALPAPRRAPTRLIIPAINVDTKVREMGWKVVRYKGVSSSEWDIPAYAAGWAKNSAVPGGGSNIVIVGHNNILGEVFRYLSNLQVGDTATLYVGNTPYTYRIEEKNIIRELGMPMSVRVKNAQWMAPTADERLTLISCWPYTGNSHRVIIVARPVNGS